MDIGILRNHTGKTAEMWEYVKMAYDRCCPPGSVLRS